MRAHHRRFSSASVGRSDPARSSSISIVRQVGGKLLLVHALTAIMLLTNTFAPYLSTRAAAAPASSANLDMTLNAPDPDQPPPLPRPDAVVVGGDFQAALGCPKDFDKTCDITALQANDDGTW